MVIFICELNVFNKRPTVKVYAKTKLLPEKGEHVPMERVEGGKSRKKILEAIHAIEMQMVYGLQEALERTPGFSGFLMVQGNI